MTADHSERDHVFIRFASGELYDGGIGVHSDVQYLNKFIIIDMTRYDQNELEKWSYGLDRKYPRFCPNFNKTKVTEIINKNLGHLFEINVMEQK
jgi:hypothetical protein